MSLVLPSHTQMVIWTLLTQFFNFAIENRRLSDLGGICANHSLIGLSWSVYRCDANKTYMCVEVIGITVNWQEASTSQCLNSQFIDETGQLAQMAHQEWLELPTGFEAGVCAFSLISSFLVPGHMQPLAPAEASIQNCGSPAAQCSGSGHSLPNKAWAPFNTSSISLGLRTCNLFDNVFSLS